MAQKRTLNLSKKMRALSEKLAAVDTIRDPRQQRVRGLRYMKQMALVARQMADGVAELGAAADKRATAARAGSTQQRQK